RRIELALHRESDFSILEGVEDIGFGHRLQTLVLNPADDRPFAYVEDYDFPVRVIGAVLHFEPDVFKISRVPQGSKIPVQSFRLVRITVARKNAGAQRLAANPAVAFEFDSLYVGLVLIFLRILAGAGPRICAGDSH